MSVQKNNDELVKPKEQELKTPAPPTQKKSSGIKESIENSKEYIKTLSEGVLPEEERKFTKTKLEHSMGMMQQFLDNLVKNIITAYREFVTNWEKHKDFCSQLRILLLNWELHYNMKTSGVVLIGINFYGAVG